jgi:hypothetical protein
MVVMLTVHIETIEHNNQRYETCGDWWQDEDGTYQIRVSDMGDWCKELLVAIHELIEQSLCQHRGITEESVSNFDKAHLDSEEPGNLPEAPYHKEHVFATYLEKQLSDELGVDWDEYEKVVQAL